jgi:hypothetical protein
VQEAFVLGRTMTYLHRQCIIDEAVAVDRPSRGCVFAANDITHEVWCLWLVLCGQKFVSQRLRSCGKWALLINCAYLFALVHATCREFPQMQVRIFDSRYALHDIDEPWDLNGADAKPEKFCNLI